MFLTAYPLSKIILSTYQQTYVYLFINYAYTRVCLLFTVFIVQVLTECVPWDVGTPIYKYEGDEAGIVNHI